MAKKEKRGAKSNLNKAVKNAVVNLLSEGKTQQEISNILGLSARTLQLWKKQDEEFFRAIEQAKVNPDDLVEAALFQRAIGYSHPEDKIFMHDGCPVVEPTTKHYPPDTAAASLWLRNRRPDKWRDKTDVDLKAPEGIKVIVEDYCSKKDGEKK